jgi:hypothetical protein
MAKSDESITFKCTPEFKAWLQKQAFDSDKGASELIRSCIILAMPQVTKIRGLDRLELEDIRE